LRQPDPLPPYEDLKHLVQQYRKSCPQQGFTLPDAIHNMPGMVDLFNEKVTKLYERLTPDDEDCKSHAISPDLAELNHL
jgi:hypothetical protein